MDSHALKVLEYDKVLAALSEHTATEMGRELALTLFPAQTLAEAERRQTETAEARRIRDEFGGMPLGGLRNLVPYLDKALMSGMLLGSELLEIKWTLQSCDRLSTFLEKRSSLVPNLAAMAANLISMPAIVDGISQAVDDAGEVKDSASEKLAKLRREGRTTVGRIQDRLNGIIHSASMRDALQDPVIVTRHGRWCVPVRSEHRGAVPGLVHDASASGATLFIEPQAVVELGNRLREIEAAETEEVQRILRRLSHQVALKADEIRITCSAIADIDLANACAVYAEALKAVRPRLSAKPYLKYAQARHPLLKGDVVPIDIRIGSDFKGLLITGPNTGGKTVTLKTVGLLMLMAQSGLQIPADEGSESGIFADVFADIGDEQSIEQSLSTFSGHIKNIIHTLENVGPKSLVLFDELGAGTDPGEGAALARAVLKQLARMEVCVIATSHYAELKTFAFLTDGFENASVEFDSESLRPTYKLLVGVPGSSQALYIAERLGMPQDVLEDARDELKRGSTETEELIRQVEQSRIRALEEERKAAAALRDVETLKGRYQRDLDKLEQTRGKVRDQVQTEAMKVVRDTQSELEKVLRELRTQKRHTRNTEGLANKAKRLLQKLENANQKIAAPAHSQPADESGEQMSFKKGDRVRMRGVDAVGVLLQDPDGDLALVAFGQMEARIALERLTRVEEKNVSTKADLARSGTSIQVSKAISVSPELMLRGQRVDEALERLDRYLDDACLAGLEKVRVIHGKGTGVMRKAVWEFMRKHPMVDSLQMADATEGGDGATIVKLK